MTDISETYRAAARVLIIGALASGAACATTPQVGTDETRRDWRAYGGDALGSRFSPLTGIDRDNVTRLEKVWTYNTGEPLPTPDRRRSLEVTPIVIRGVIYISTPLGRVVALDPVTGREIWKYDARVDAAVRFGDFTNRVYRLGATGSISQQLMPG